MDWCFLSCLRNKKGGEISPPKRVIFKKMKDLLSCGIDLTRRGFTGFPG